MYELWISSLWGIVFESMVFIIVEVEKMGVITEEDVVKYI
jgi:hypothetical protein